MKPAKERESNARMVFAIFTLICLTTIVWQKVEAEELAPFIPKNEQSVTDQPLQAISKIGHSNLPLFWQELGTRLGVANEQGVRERIAQGRLELRPCIGFIRVAGVNTKGRAEYFTRSCEAGEQIAWLIYRGQEVHEVPLFSTLCGNPVQMESRRIAQGHPECRWTTILEPSVEEYGGLHIDGNGEFITPLGGGNFFNLGSTAVHLPSRTWSSALEMHSKECRTTGGK